MRSSTKTFVASVGLGVCALSYAVGANSATGSNFMANGAPSLTNTAAAPDQTSASPSTSSAPSNSAGAGTSAKPTKKPSVKTGSSSAPSSSGSSAAPAPSTAPAPSKSTAPAPSQSTAPAPAPSQSTAPASTTATNTGSLFTERNYGGRVQVTVTKTNGQVTAVNFAVATATGGRAGAFGSLAQMAVASNGAAVSKISGATYTTNTFNLALASAMSKF